MRDEGIRYIIGFGAVVLVFLVLIASMYTPRKRGRNSALVLAAFALAGDWITTGTGTRVCQLRYDLSHAMTLQPGFCDNWQPPFLPPHYAQTAPFHEGWIRRRPYGAIQLHVEKKGWVP